MPIPFVAAYFQRGEGGAGAGVLWYCTSLAKQQTKHITHHTSHTTGTFSAAISRHLPTSTSRRCHPYLCWLVVMVSCFFLGGTLTESC